MRIDSSPATYNLQLATSSVSDFITLLKPGVMSLVVFTGWVGMILAPGTLNPLLQMIAVLSIAAGSGASGAINMWFDRDIDAIMTRTQKRPIPMGRIAPEEALSFGIVTSLFSVMLLGLATNWLAAGLLATAILFYVGIYTVWLKRRTPQNIVIGGAAGAFPPMIGWAAVTGDISLFSIILFLIIFFWTPPHFWALALFRSGDYVKAGVPMLPAVRGLASTKRHILAYTLILLPITLLPSFTHAAGSIYAVGAFLLGLRFLFHAAQVLKDETDRSSKRMFGYSILYLFALFALLVVDKLLDKSLFSGFLPLL